MQEPITVSFDELDLGFGQTLQLLTNPGDKSSVFACELIGCLQNESLIIGPPHETGVLPRLVEGQKIVVRLLLAGGVAMFPTTVLYVSDIPTVMAYLDYPRGIKFKQVRAAPRVDITLPIIGNNKTNPAINAVPGKIVDISTLGARIAMFESLGNVGEKIDVKGKFQIGSLQRTIGIGAILRAQHQQKDAFVYGVEFDEQDEDKLIVLLGFTFHAMVYGTLQKIH